MAAPSGSACSTRCWSPALGIVFATVLGFVIGIARLSKNWLVARLAGVYVELIRNLPLLLQLLFWYNAVLKVLPELRDSVLIPGGGFLNNRGLFLPQPVFKEGFGAVLAALVVGDRRRDRVPLSGPSAGRCCTGQQAPVFRVTLALVIGLPLACACC